MSDENDENVSPNEPREEQRKIEPYTILKLNRNASEEDIQRSYKLLSRSFHPDKQAPGPARDAAQEVFVSFKNAADILIDPVQRQVYDDHGHDGIVFVRRSLHSTEKDPNSLYPTLSKLHQAGKPQDARLVFRQALQQADIEQRERAVQLSATLEFPCTLESHKHFGGDETFPELKDARLSFSVTSASPADSKWGMSVGGTSSVENGKGAGHGSVSIEYLPVQGTIINADCDIGDPFKLSIGTMRTLSSRTLLSAQLRTIPNSKHLSLSVTSHRALFERKVRGSWALGMGTDLKFHYGQLSFTTLSHDYPQLTAKLNLGMNPFPLKLSARHEFEKSKMSAFVSYAWGPSGIEVKTILSRALSSYAVWSIGVKHSVQSGLTWLLQLERNDICFRIPITVCARQTPAYWEYTVVLSVVSLLIDNVIGEAAADSQATETTKKELKRESSLLDNEKSHRDAELQVQLMLKSALASRAREEACNGLVILKATYWIDGGETMDATTQMQFRVNDSKLSLPSTAKCHLLGFYSLATATKASKTAEPWYRSWLPWFASSKEPQEGTSSQAATPKLTVRYSFQGRVYETTIEETEGLVLPQSTALCLGESEIVLE